MKRRKTKSVKDFALVMQHIRSSFEDKKKSYFLQCDKIVVAECGCFSGFRQSWTFEKGNFPSEDLCQYDFGAILINGDCTYWTFFKDNVQLGQLQAGTKCIEKLKNLINKENENKYALY